MHSCLIDYLEFNAKDRSNEIFAEDETLSISFLQTHLKVTEWATSLQNMGLVKGDRVAILAKNSVNQALLYLACIKAGVVVVGLNYRLTPNEWKFIISDSQAKYIFLDEEFVSELNEDQQAVPLICMYGKSKDVDNIDDVFKKNKSKPFKEQTVDRSDTVMQMYTSGTTGFPKGVLISHENIIENTQQSYLTSRDFPTSDSKFLLIAPIFHIAGASNICACFMFGMTVFICREFNPMQFVADIQDKKITSLTAIPVMLQFAVAHVPDIEKYDFSSLRCISYGASPISETLLKQCLKIFNCNFVQGYGQTESTGCVTMLTMSDHQRALQEKPELLRSCGRAIMGTQVAIFDENDSPLAPGEVGEIVAKGKQIMSGYWNLTDATEKTLSSGWLHTGDAGYMDEDGYIYLCDRIKDIIISGGENIYPTEIENVILSHPEIKDAAVIGVDDEKWGEVPLLIIADAKPEKKMTLEDIHAFCQGKIASFKLPKYIEYVDELPRNASGKILKKILREQFKK